MERIAAILVIFVLLINGRHVERRLPQAPHAIVVTAIPIPLDNGDPGRRMLGPLVYLGGWSLEGTGGDLGGVSAMRLDGHGNLLALNDTGELATFHPGEPTAPGVLMPLPAFSDEAGDPKWHWDTESMAHDPVSGKIWVGFELNARICRYSAGFARVERCASPAEMLAWPKPTGLESLVRLKDGRFLGIAEDYPGPAGGHEMLLFAGDPVSPATQHPARLSYRAPEGYLPTDALDIGHGRMLVLNRRVTLVDGFTGVLTLVDISDLRPGALLTGMVVARFAGSVQHDNLEALAMSREAGRPILWVASDDNHLFFQRSLLLKFAMPADWFESRP
ncbi:hypothetical protein BH10PSE13_BH10PSE13_15680 [soil metagenome]